ncbi:hypothetical protein TELCIR_15457, partial [Teladorsagia circumcincta]
MLWAKSFAGSSMNHGKHEQVFDSEIIHRDKMNGSYRTRIFSREGCSPPWMDPRHGSSRSSPFTSPAPASTSDSCDMLIEEGRRASFTRNSMFLFDDEVELDNE